MMGEPDGMEIEAWSASDAEMMRLLERSRPRLGAAAEARIRAAVFENVQEQTRPRHLRLLIAVYGCCGLLLLALAALGLAGVGPLAF